MKDSMRLPLGILAWCDEVALQAIHCVREAGWQVPEQVKVIGIGNHPAGAAAEIPLTTMGMPRQEITRLAAAVLVNQMRDPTHQPERIRLSTRLIIRESCGTYRRSNNEA
jgi:LacI family transcriptional regulator